MLFPKKIITISEFSKKMILEKSNLDTKKIDIIYPSWQHIDQINPDFTVLDSYNLPSNFILVLGSKMPHKNLQWVFENAKKNMDVNYVIVGGGNLTYQSDLNNIIELPYLNDGMIKALYIKCEAILLPSYFEGFGLTPLEAMACGAKAIVANTASMPEIYENSAYYIDPYNPNINLNELMEKNTIEDKNLVLSKFSWTESAKKLIQLINDL